MHVDITREGWIAATAPVNCTDPEKLPAGLVVAGVVLDAGTFLQLPKDAPACKGFAIFRSFSFRAIGVAELRMLH